MQKEIGLSVDSAQLLPVDCAGTTLGFQVAPLHDVVRAIVITVCSGPVILVNSTLALATGMIGVGARNLGYVVYNVYVVVNRGRRGNSCIIALVLRTVHPRIWPTSVFIKRPICLDVDARGLVGNTFLNLLLATCMLPLVREIGCSIFLAM